MAQIFISHSKLDTKINEFFAGIFGRTNVRGKWVEYDKFQVPPWQYIEQEITKSTTLFVLLGPNVELLAHTKVWIGSETGAVPPGKAVWVFENHQHTCNIPIPNVHHYMLYDFSEAYENYIRAVVESYDDSATLPSLVAGGLGGAAVAGPLGAVVGGLLLTVATSPAKNRPMGVVIKCHSCNTSFNLHTKKEVIPCPVCRKPIQIQWDAP